MPYENWKKNHLKIATLYYHNSFFLLQKLNNSMAKIFKT